MFASPRRRARPASISAIAARAIGYRAAVRELADLPARVLLTIGNASEEAELGTLPANVHVERWVPQEDVVPHAAANVAEIGAGVALPAPAPATVRAAAEHATEALAGLGDIVQRLLDEPRYARAARRVAEPARALPPVNAAANVLPAIAGEGVTARGGEGASRVAA